MAKKPTVTTLQSGFNSTEVLNENFENIRDAFDNTLSLDGSTPNAMQADLDLNGNNLIGATGLLINGTDYLADVEAAKAAALVAQAAAELAENNAETAEVNAEASETAAGLSATAAATSATNAGASETAASASATASATSATNSATSASQAATSASAAAVSEGNAATSETNAANSATSASGSASTATTQASAASVSATNAATSASNAATSATNAAASQAAAATSETNAAASESTVTTSATNAATSEANAATSASTATTQATNAATSASTASTSATNAATSETNAASSASSAASSATSAQASKDAALAALDSFDDRYLGQKVSDPTLDNDGNALVAGALYFNTTDGIMKVYDGSVWLAAYASLSGALIATNNLSDVLDVTASRTNLGLGTAATTASTDYATAAQGALAVSAVQPNDSPSFGSVTVTGTVDGRNVAADGSKLDGIEAGATADQTASEILTSIKTVDGSGSGLDADLLDGIHASSFLQGNQTITLSGDVSGSGTTSILVTVADDSHNHIIANVDGLQTALDGKWSKGADIGGGVDLNTYTTDGYYHQNSNANASSGSNYPVALAGMLEVTSDGSMVYQRYTTYNSVHTVYVRTYYSGTWYNWAKQWDNLNDGSGSGLDADLLDGQQGSYYYPASNPNGYTAYTNSDVDTHLNTGTATTDQVLSWNGTDYDWIDGGGAPPTDLHAVGTYTVACTGVNVAQGGTTAGSNLRYRNIYALDRFTVLTTTSSTVTLTGTWRNVGGPVQYVSGRGGGQRGVSLWVRIS